VRRSDISLSRLAGREFKRLRKRARKLNWASTDAELHRTRILCKRARYAAEFAEPDMGKRARRVAKRFAGLQDVLGEHQDAIVAEARLRELLAKAPGAGVAFAAGRLVERERRRPRPRRTPTAGRRRRAGRRSGSARSAAWSRGRPIAPRPGRTRASRPRPASNRPRCRRRRRSRAAPRARRPRRPRRAPPPPRP